MSFSQAAAIVRGTFHLSVTAYKAMSFGLVRNAAKLEVRQKAYSQLLVVARLCGDCLAQQPE